MQEDLAGFRSELVIQVVNDEGETQGIRFSNDDGTGIKIDFSAISISLISSEDGDFYTLGEFEELNEIEEGFEIIGDFGLIWVTCKKCMPWR